MNKLLSSKTFSPQNAIVLLCQSYWLVANLYVNGLFLGNIWYLLISTLFCCSPMAMYWWAHNTILWKIYAYCLLVLSSLYSVLFMFMLNHAIWHYAIGNIFLISLNIIVPTISIITYKIYRQIFIWRVLVIYTFLGILYLLCWWTLVCGMPTIRMINKIKSIAHAVELYADSPEQQLLILQDSICANKPQYDFSTYIDDNGSIHLCAYFSPLDTLCVSTIVVSRGGGIDIEYDCNKSKLNIESSVVRYNQIDKVTNN